MPSSSHLQITDLMDWVVHLEPRSVLDIGVGNGKYGFLCREALDDPHAQPPTRIVLRGIEAYPQYLGEVHRLVYDEILVGNCVDILQKHQERYDLTLFVDVIEHLEKEQGHQLLNRILEISRNVIVATPKGFAPQDDVYGNTFEIHRSGWEESDFQRYPGHLTKVVENKVLALVGQDAERLKKALLKGKIMRLIHGNRLVASTFRAAHAAGLTNLKVLREKLGF
jgi:hypothetical protein